MVFKSTKMVKYKICFRLILTLLIYSCSSEIMTNKEVIDEDLREINFPSIETNNQVEDLYYSTATIRGMILDNGGSSVLERGVCYGLTENPTIDDLYEKASVTFGSGEFKVNLSRLQANTIYYARAYAVNEKGVGYGNEIIFTTASIALPVLEIGDTKVAGAHDIWLNVSVPLKGDLEIDEIGVVYGISSQPTLEDHKITQDQFENTFIQRITGLEQQTIYYIRSYAITSYAVTYSDEITTSTIKEGNFTWSFWWEDSSNPAFNRLREAFDKATWYYNNFTSIEKHVNVNYSPGTPTADANIDGWINFGSNPDYQRTGTAMHELAHTVGVGTHWKYWELMQNSWQGNRANDILKFIINDPNARINGDSTHFWPYGINGAHEDDGSEMLYIIHSLIIQGMKADGLPSN